MSVSDAVSLEGPPGPVAILAGSGELPTLLADRLAAVGRPHRILAFRGFCDRMLRARADAVVDLLEVGRIHACLQSWQPAAVTLAGGLARPSPSALLGAYSAFKARDELAAIVARGDDNLLRGAIGLLEDRGFRLVGVRDLAPDLLARQGPYGAHRPEAAHERAIEVGFALLDGLSAFDCGQAVAVSGERVLAIEGPEGTDRMLARAGALSRPRLFGRRSRGGVLVKAPKRGQDIRVDLPAIGPRTVARAARAGLDGIAIEAGSTLVIDEAATVAAADRLGLFLVGMARDGEARRG